MNPLAVAAFLVARANDGPYSARQATGADQVEQEMDRCTDLGLRC